MIGVIPAAGKASRMGRLGNELPKALIEIDGRTLLEQAITSLKSMTVSSAVVVVGHLGEQIREFIATRSFGIDIRIVAQERPLGLAHAIATAANEIRDDFVVLCPDNVFTDLTDLVSARKLFETNEGTFMLLATVTPNQQRDRKSYFPAAHRNRDENLFDYLPQNTKTAGLPINSTGCC